MSYVRNLNYIIMIPRKKIVYVIFEMDHYPSPDRSCHSFYSTGSIYAIHKQHITPPEFQITQRFVFLEALQDISQIFTSWALIERN